MIVKFHSRGVGCGSGPVDYLLGRDRERDAAKLLSGDPELVIALCDSSPYAKKYTSGVLSFEEPDLSEELKAKLMSSFEKTLFPGLDIDQYACLWVEHKDKGRLELNFLIPNVELQTGKRLQPYFDRVDRPRVNAWKIMVNTKYKLHDPDDPKNHRTLVTANDLPKSKQEIAQKITDSLLNLASRGQIQERQDVINLLREGGFTLTRETQKSISIADPEGGRNIRLKGAIYEQNFRFGNELREEIERAGQRYRQGAEKRFQAAQLVYSKGIEEKREYNHKRYHRQSLPNLEISKGTHSPSPTFSGIDWSDNINMGLSRDANSLLFTRDESFTKACNRGAEEHFSGIDRENRTTEITVKGIDSRYTEEKSHSGAPESSRIGSEICQMREALVYTEGQVSISRMETSGRQSTDVHPRGVLKNDGFRDSIIESVRDFAERTRERAQKLCDHVQGFVKNIQRYKEYESEPSNSIDTAIEANRNLAKASDGIERVIESEKELIELEKGKTLEIDYPGFFLSIIELGEGVYGVVTGFL